MGTFLHPVLDQSMQAGTGRTDRRRMTCVNRPSMRVGSA
jgi:hypothetical protein